MVIGKLRISFFLCLLIGFSALLVNGCRKSDRFTRRVTPISFQVPEGFPPIVYDFSANPLTEEGFALGKKLFHDNRLSANNDVTCGSCHQQVAAYTTFDHDLGHGTNFQHTTRNVPVIFNMVWHSEFEWDGRVPDLDSQMISCMEAPEKMGQTAEQVSAKISGDTEYRRLFSEAFGDEMPSEDRMAKAMAQFVALMVSADSKYDRMINGQAVFNDSEQNGYLIFKEKCSGCHTEPLFTDLQFRNNGLPGNSDHHDAGRMEVTGDPGDSLKFKVPTLRNVTLSGYYGHDGRFPAFSQMLNHYNNGIIQSGTLDPALANNIPLTDLEKFYLQEFLFTLNDTALVNDPRFEREP